MKLISTCISAIEDGKWPCYHGILSSSITALQLIDCTRFVIWCALLLVGTGFRVNLLPPGKSQDCRCDSEAIRNIGRFIHMHHWTMVYPQQTRHSNTTTIKPHGRHEVWNHQLLDYLFIGLLRLYQRKQQKQHCPALLVICGGFRQ